MTLKLKQIRLTNWKCYKSENISLDLDSDRNISIIFGQNGYGKTSLMEAILWCLYGNDIIGNGELKKYFHRAERDGRAEKELRVELNFTDKGKNYYITRSATLKARGKEFFANPENATYNEDGQDKINPKDYIDALLPPSIRDFFCFDGVKIEQYARVTQTEEAKEAIEKVLGIPELRNLRYDTDIALKDLDKQLNKAAASRPELNRKTKELADLDEEIELKKAQVRDARRQEREAIKIHQDAIERASQIEDLRHQLDRLEELERQKSVLQMKLETARKAVNDWLKKASIPLLLNFVQEMVDELQVKTLKTTRKSVSIATLKDILKDETCLCGRCLDRDSREYILQQIEGLEELGNLADEMIEKDRLKGSLQGILDANYPSFDNLLLARDGLEEDMEDLDRQIQHLKQDTAGTSRDEANQIWRKVGEWEQKVKGIQEKIDRLYREIDIREKQAESLRGAIELLAGQDKITKTLSEQVTLARGLRDAANELIEWHIDRSRQRITDITTERYCQVTNKPDEYVGVEITEDYTLGVRTVTGELLQPDVLSAGEKEALAFAFITGLNQASRTAAPLIMDTPFGHLDTEHQRKIIESLPNLNSQVIVLATDRDFPEELLTLIRPHIAKTLTIRRMSADEDASTIDREE
ncbi:AAA family ATPase [Pannus brasiliensis CCIBt3594]|uniref:Nuclease SbcCD subunit C n=1 Tax=Pannus brasiliensis CCIBt3594 TaxID=1427578 RepID=A0AAW9R0P2_9CHRO